MVLKKFMWLVLTAGLGVACTLCARDLLGQKFPPPNRLANAALNSREGLHSRQLQRALALRRLPDPARALLVAKLPTSANSSVTSTTCPPEAVGAACGFVSVPVDRKNPGGAQISIYFELYPHTQAGPAISAIVGDPGGGGGDSTTVDNRLFFQLLFGGNLDTHDLLLIDGRGRGFSEALDCEELQHGTAPFTKAIADCAAQLGPDASFHGSGDVAEDIEAVRAALGYDKLDFYGGSWGGVVVTAYATRFGQHLRSIVLDSPVGEPGLNGFVFDQVRAQNLSETLAIECRHSPTCGVDHPSAAHEIDDLVASIRAHPVEGDTLDASGNLVHVRINEEALLNFVLFNHTFTFFPAGEILAAAAALKNGDKAPLLRLAAEGYFTLEGDSGDPTGFSVGAAVATCVDYRPVPWDWSVPVATRLQQYRKAVRKLPANFFFPFSTSAPTSLIFSSNKGCLWWEEPTPPQLVRPQHAAYPRLPTLVISGEVDFQLPMDRKVAALFPQSSSVTIADALHKPTTFLFAGANCAADIASHFVEALTPGDTTCAKQPFYTWPAVGRFPSLVKDARPAEVDPSGNNLASSTDRKAVTVAVAAITDALQRSFFVNGDGFGLRGGTYHTDFGPSWTTKLNNAAFASDVFVSGTVTWRIGTDSSLSADLTLSGPGTKGGKLHVEGAWLFVAPVSKFKVSGLIGGHNVALLVPEA